MHTEEAPLLVVLPIHPDYHKTENPYYHLANRFPYGLAGLAHYVLLSGYDSQNFITDCTEHLILDYCNEEYDNDLDQYNHDRFVDAVMSNGFNLFLQLFYDAHASLYKLLMPDIRPLEPFDLHPSSGNKLVIRLVDYETI